jgi:putative sterol carrier protein
MQQNRRKRMADPTISEFMSRMTAAFVPEKAAGLDATIQLKFTGDQATEWYIEIKDNKCTVSQGSAQTAKLTVTVDSGDFIKLYTGKLDGMQAYMQGRLKVSGDMNLALKLFNLFKFK